MDILFLTSTRIGDAVLSTGLLSYLAERYRNARITIAVGPAAAPLFEAVPGLRRILVVDKQPYGLHWLGLWAKTVVRRWDLVVDLRGSALSYLLWTGERRISGKGDIGEHRVRELGRLFGLEPPPAPHLWLADRHEKAAAALIPSGGPVLAIGPAANWRGKQWRAERFAELAQILTAPEGILPGARIAVMAAAHERTQAEPLLAALPKSRLIDLVGGSDLLTVAAALKRMALFVGNDTGLTHIAAAVGVPTLGLFGPSHPTRFAPWGERTAFVQTAIPYDALVGTPGYDHRTTGTLMDSLTVDAVEAAVRDLWRRAGATPA